MSIESMESKILRLVDTIKLEHLIKEVEQHPAIWNPAVEEYGIKVERRRAWYAIIHTFFPNFDDMPLAEKNELRIVMQRKWKGIRTCYTRELQKQKQEKNGEPSRGRKQYLHFQALHFLRPVSFCKKEIAGNTKLNREHKDVGDFLEIVSNQTTNSILDEIITGDPDVDSETEEEKVLKIQKEDKKAEKQNCKQPIKRKVVNKDDDELIHILMKKVLRYENATAENDEDRLFLLSLTSELHKVAADRKLKLKSDIIAAISQAQQTSHEKQKCSCEL